MGKQDFIVDANSHCLICWSNGGQPPPPPNCSVLEDEDPSSSTYYSLASLQSLSKFLKLDMEVVFNGTEHIPPQLLVEVKRSRLKSELCKECTNLMDTFSKLFQQLERLEMEIGSCLEIIYGKMLKAEEECKRTTSVGEKLFGEGKTSSEGDLVRGKLQIVEAIRREALNKCRGKIRNVSPRVHLENLDPKTIVKSTQQVKFEYPPVVPKVEQSHFETDEDYDNSEDAIPPDHTDFDEMAYEEDNVEQGSKPQDANDTSRSTRLRTVHRCTNCRKTFASPVALRSHRDSRECDDEMEAEFSSGKSDSDSRGTDVAAVKSSDAAPNARKKSNRKIGRQLPSRSMRDRSKDFTIDSKTGSQRCRICFKTFAKYQTAWRHFRTDHEKVREKCKICGKEFRQRGSLIRHQLSAHTKIRFKCSGCHKIYKQKGHLREHQKLCNIEPSHL